jgi:hypothetical protein
MGWAFWTAILMGSTFWLQLLIESIKSSKCEIHGQMLHLSLRENDYHDPNICQQTFHYFHSQEKIEPPHLLLAVVMEMQSYILDCNNPSYCRITVPNPAWPQKPTHEGL